MQKGILQKLQDLTLDVSEKEMVLARRNMPNFNLVSSKSSSSENFGRKEGDVGEHTTVSMVEQGSPRAQSQIQHVFGVQKQLSQKELRNKITNQYSGHDYRSRVEPKSLKSLQGTQGDQIPDANIDMSENIMDDEEFISEPSILPSPGLNLQESEIRGSSILLQVPQTRPSNILHASGLNSDKYEMMNTVSSRAIMTASAEKPY